MAKMTPEREAAYALDYGVARSDLSEAARPEYDRLAAMPRAAGAPAPPPDLSFDQWARTSPEARARVAGLFKRGKYALPFRQDRLAAASIVGTESWAEYGQIVLQTAILDTLLSIEEKLSGTGPGES